LRVIFPGFTLERGWPATPDAWPPPRKQFTGHPACNLAQLRQDLERFAFLLGGSDGEQLFGQ
jgi:hypothetical protein